MHAENLTTYLNDHLAGSVGALELLQHLAETSSPVRRGEILALRGEIKSEQTLIKELLDALATHESVVKKAGAWMAEKVAHLKLRLTAAGNSALGTMEAYEVLSLGIEGKKGLWRSLQAVASNLPTPPALDLHALIAAAKSQRSRVEAWRMEASIIAFTPSAP